MKKVWGLLAMAWVMFLGGCGGGGGGGPATPSIIASTASFDVAAAWRSYAQMTGFFPFSLSATVSGQSATGSGTQQRFGVGTTTFQATTVTIQAYNYNGTISGGGSTIPLSTGGNIYFDANLSPLRLYDGVLTWTLSNPAWASLPTSARVNDTGVLGSVQVSASGPTLRSGDVTWALQAYSAGSSDLKFMFGASPYFYEITLRILPSGQISEIFTRDSVGTDTVTLQYSL